LHLYRRTAPGSSPRSWLRWSPWLQLALAVIGLVWSIRILAASDATGDWVVPIVLFGTLVLCARVLIWVMRLRLAVTRSHNLQELDAELVASQSRWTRRSLASLEYQIARAAIEDPGRVLSVEQAVTRSRDDWTLGIFSGRWGLVAWVSVYAFMAGFGLGPSLLWLAETLDLLFWGLSLYIDTDPAALALPWLIVGTFLGILAFRVWRRGLPGIEARLVSRIYAAVNLDPSARQAEIGAVAREVVDMQSTGRLPSSGDDIDRGQDLTPTQRWRERVALGSAMFVGMALGVLFGMSLSGGYW